MEAGAVHVAAVLSPRNSMRQPPLTAETRADAESLTLRCWGRATVRPSPVLSPKKSLCLSTIPLRPI